MRYAWGVSAALVVLAAILVGVYSSGHGSADRADKKLTGVAVVDLDELAKRLGVDVALAKQVKDARVSLDQQLQSLQASLRQQYQQKSQEMKSPQTTGGQPSNADPTAAKRQLAELEQQMNVHLAQAQQTARGKFEAYRVGLIQSFRGEVVPVAKEVAAAYGLGVVISKNDSVLLAFDEAHDITGAVAAKLRENRPNLGVSEPSATVARAEAPASKVR